MFFFVPPPQKVEGQGARKSTVSIACPYQPRRTRPGRLTSCPRRRSLVPCARRGGLPQSTPMGPTCSLSRKISQGELCGESGEPHTPHGNGRRWWESIYFWSGGVSSRACKSIALGCCMYERRRCCRGFIPPSERAQCSCHVDSQRTLAGTNAGLMAAAKE